MKTPKIVPPFNYYFSAYGCCNVRNLLDLREQLLNEYYFDDAYLHVSWNGVSTFCYLIFEGVLRDCVEVEVYCKYNDVRQVTRSNSDF